MQVYFEHKIHFSFHNLVDDNFHDIALLGRCNNRKVVTAIASQSAGTSCCTSGWGIQPYAGVLKLKLHAVVLELHFAALQDFIMCELCCLVGVFS